MTIARVTYEQDLQAILTGFRGLSDGRPTHEGSDTFTQASVLAGLSQDLRARIAWVHDQNFVDTAASDLLERHALLRTNITRRPPAGASGSVDLSGSSGTAFSAGLEMVDQQGQEFKLSEGGTLDGNGEATVAAEAVSTGASTNLQAGAVLTLVSPPAGLTAQADVSAAWTGGTDTESDAELLARHLWLLRHPPAGGNKYDYVSWAMSVAGVYQAYVFSLRRGLGTCDVVILTDSVTRLPSAGLVADVQALIDEKRPTAAKDSDALVPDTKSVDITAQITVTAGYNFSEVKSRVEADLDSLFADLAPGDGLTVSLIETTISLVEGVDDRTVSAPAANVTATVSESTVELLIAGTITITETP